VSQDADRVDVFIRPAGRHGALDVHLSINLCGGRAFGQSMTRFGGQRPARTYVLMEGRNNFQAYILYASPVGDRIVARLWRWGKTEGGSNRIEGLLLKRCRYLWEYAGKYRVGKSFRGTFSKSEGSG